MISGFGVAVGIAWMVGALGIMTVGYAVLPKRTKKRIIEFIDNIE